MYTEEQVQFENSVQLVRQLWSFAVSAVVSTEGQESDGCCCFAFVRHSLVVFFVCIFEIYAERAAGPLQLWGRGLGRCFNFHSGRGAGGGGGGLDPSLPPLDSLPPPLRFTSESGLCEYFFVWASFFLPRLRCTYSRVLWSLHCIFCSLCCRHHVPASHMCILQHPVPTVSPPKTRGRCKRDPLFSLPRKMDWEERARGIQCGTESMFDIFSEHSMKCPPQAVTRHPSQILLVLFPAQKRMMTFLSPAQVAQVSQNLIDFWQTI